MNYEQLAQATGNLENSTDMQQFSTTEAIQALIGERQFVNGGNLSEDSRSTGSQDAEQIAYEVLSQNGGNDQSATMEEVDAEFNRVNNEINIEEDNQDAEDEADANTTHITVGY